MEKQEPRGISQVVPEGYFLTKQVADYVGKSADTIRKWRNSGAFPATTTMEVGKTKMKVYVYSESDRERLKEFAKTVKPGRRPKVQET